MQTATEIIDSKGGTVKVAIALDLTPSTVSSWKTAKKGIPRWWKPQVDELPDVAPKACPAESASA